MPAKSDSDITLDCIDGPVHHVLGHDYLGPRSGFGRSPEDSLQYLGRSSPLFPTRLRWLDERRRLQHVPALCTSYEHIHTQLHAESFDRCMGYVFSTFDRVHSKKKKKKRFDLAPFCHKSGAISTGAHQHLKGCSTAQLLS